MAVVSKSKNGGPGPPFKGMLSQYNFGYSPRGSTPCPTSPSSSSSRAPPRKGRCFARATGAERLCGVMAAFGTDQHLAYSPYVHPITSNGIRCVVVDMRLEEVEPMALPIPAEFREGQRAEGASRASTRADEACGTGARRRRQCLVLPDASPRECGKAPRSGRGPGPLRLLLERLDGVGQARLVASGGVAVNHALGGRAVDLAHRRPSGRPRPQPCRRTRRLS